MAMLLTQAMRSSGHPEYWLHAAELGRWLDRIPFRYARIPAWFPGPGGATHPLAALRGLRDYGRKLRHEGRLFPWTAVLRTRQSFGDLEAAIGTSPTLIYGVGPTGIPHVVVPIAQEGHNWKILDPGLPSNRNPVNWSDDQLQSWWRNYSILYPRGTMISLQPAGEESEADRPTARAT